MGSGKGGFQKIGGVFHGFMITDPEKPPTSASVAESYRPRIRACQVLAASLSLYLLPEFDAATHDCSVV